ncbi:hypothetical protein GCM10009795_090180 [Nocardioides hankookensis]|uniref:Uncharacterized protein n=1 Tax=Klebsiella pneumoniae TaxID=573 RepID=A0A455XEH0_KLEPN|nr:hypothetical protein [Klebsiella pneumoniae]BDC25676.1 hypothetical protein OCUBac04_52470 [Klebsiella pneumoniae]GKI45139.1 hypothetical protein NUBL13784_47950 [Klebsiella pneumoniae]GKJ04833.1 hypothetical protein NUBL21978_46390 [Klebsiella pneumoniae]GKJ79229.1 hypothetical protein NUBL21984_36590 [Klebsiella pneumoniae]
MPFQVAGFNPSNFHVTQQGFKPNPYHCKVPYVSQVVAFMQRPAKNIEIGYKKWKGLAGDDFFLILPRPPYLNQCFYQNVAEVWKTQAAVNA